MADSPTAAELQVRIDAARREYEVVRGRLEQQLGREFSDAGDVADRLLSVTDEFGRDHAVGLILERPDDYGERHGGRDGDWQEVAARIGDDVDRLVELHEKLDDLTRDREALTGQDRAGEHVRVINIQGREYEFDGERNELREIEPSGRPPEHAEQPRLTAIERAMRDTKAGKAEPQPERDRTRGR